MKPIDLTGKVFGRLTAVSMETGPKRKWNCVCSCGGSAVVVTNKLTSGYTKSCGCLSREVAVSTGKRNKVHGLGHGNGSPEYRSWTSMRERCRKRYPGRSHYFDRGISVCERWDSFSAFLEDMGQRPTGTTLDRVDVNGNYEPLNCRWATPKQQQRNKTNTNYLSFRDGNRVAMDVADEIGVKKVAMNYFIKVARLMKEKYGYLPTP